MQCGAFRCGSKRCIVRSVVWYVAVWCSERYGVVRFGADAVSCVEFGAVLIDIRAVQCCVVRCGWLQSGAVYF